MDEHAVPDSEKVKIVGEFLNLAPPGEFNEVFSDCRLLLNDDRLLRQAASSSISSYNKEQLTPVEVEGLSHRSLISIYNDLGDNRFYDPRAGICFKFDHYKKEVADIEAYQHSSVETSNLRSLLDDQWMSYCMEHYKHGVSAVFDHSDNQCNKFVLCIEHHQFQAHNYWNGRWRSIYTLSYEKGSNEASISGEVKIQVHYYEDGNVQLVANKELNESLPVENDGAAMAQRVVHIIREAEAKYQSSINENYKSMDNKTFKALRRHLPLTRSKIDWAKILSYKVASEISNKQQ